MSKIYQALKQAEKEKQATRPLSPITAQRQSFNLYALEREETGQGKALLNLYQRIDSLLPQAHKKVVQFIGSRAGEGASTIAWEFGKMTANKLNKQVLILDADQQNPQQHIFSGITPESGWEDLLENRSNLDDVIYHVKESGLSVCPVSRNVVITHDVFNSTKMVDLWSKFKERFDLIIVDSPPATESSDGIAISRHVDGVVLVLEAEKTRLPVANKAKETIEKHGGKLLGVVFNKRQFYIPDFIYRRL
jgi:protein-tyrosine kinase